jgi:hypothetical protein
LKLHQVARIRISTGLTIFLISIIASFLYLSQIVQAQADPAQIDSLNETLAIDTSDAVRPPIAPQNVTVSDNPNDAGGSIHITWDVSPDDIDGGGIASYRILRAVDTNGKPGEFTEIGDVTAGATSMIDGNTDDNLSYYYKVSVVKKAQLTDSTFQELVSESDIAGPVQSSGQWFDWRRINSFVGIFILCVSILYFIFKAQSGKELFIRKIAGLEAVDEAVGRATEMGKKIFYVPGISDMDNMQTIASMTILGRVAELAAEYETWLEVPVARSLVLVTAKEVVREAHSKSGRPDSFHEDQVHYLTDDQFGYAAGIDGMVVREKPATLFFMGEFFAESLILAETGNSIGAIQIAGTAAPAQLPFFVAACDYTLIGEELFAASAYLSKEPKLLGSLKGQDVGKAIILIALLIGIILETFGIWQFSRLFSVIE